MMMMMLRKYKERRKEDDWKGKEIEYKEKGPPVVGGIESRLPGEP